MQKEKKEQTLFFPGCAVLVRGMILFLRARFGLQSQAVLAIKLA